MEKLKVGIIGCGNIANGKHLPVLSQMDDVELVAFCDVIEERAVNTAKKFGTPDAKVYTDYKELLKDESINNVRVLTPNVMHCQITVDALMAGKHVMCEKPMAATYEDAKKMLEAKNKSGKLLTIGYQHKFDPDVVYSKQEAVKGNLGDMYYAKANVMRRRGVPTHGVFTKMCEQGGGAMIDVGTHVLDIVLYVMDNYKPKFCVGNAFDKLKYQTETGNPFGPWETEGYDVEEFATGYVVMENGAVIYLESSWALNTTDVAGVRYMICGDKAGVDNYNGKFKINGICNDKQYIIYPDLAPAGVAFTATQGASTPYQEQRVFLDAIRGKGELVTKPEAAAVVVQILDGIYKSARSGEPYYFDKD